MLWSLSECRNRCTFSTHSRSGIIVAVTQSARESSTVTRREFWLGFMVQGKYHSPHVFQSELLPNSPRLNDTLENIDSRNLVLLPFLQTSTFDLLCPTFNGRRFLTASMHRDHARVTTDDVRVSRMYASCATHILRAHIAEKRMLGTDL